MHGRTKQIVYLDGVLGSKGTWFVHFSAALIVAAVRAGKQSC